MKEQNTSVKYTRSEIDTLPDETDWERVDALTDEDIDAAAASDPDAPPTDASFWKEATVVMPENIVIVDADLHGSKPRPQITKHESMRCFDRMLRRMTVKGRVQTPALWRNFSKMHNGDVK